MGKTIAKSVTIAGMGLHSGNYTQVKLCPANPGEGRYFVRVDLPEKPIIEAKIDRVSETTLSTELVSNGAKIRTVEHLLAALAATGIEDLRIEIDGAEIPLLDGSAQQWLEAIALEQPDDLSLGKKIENPIWIHEGDSFVAALPSKELRFTYGIDFVYSAIGNQWYSWSPIGESFASAIAPARTFGFAEQIEQLRKAGLIKGGSLDNALVCDARGWLNPPLRFDNEPVRHKLLDLLGDLSLLGNFPQAHFLAYKASHKLHVQLARALRNYQ